MSFDRGMEGDRNLRYVDLTNGQVTNLFKGLFLDFGFDLITGTFIFEPISEDPATPGFPPGPYIISPTNPIPRQLGVKAIRFHWDESLQRLVSKDIPCQEGYIGSLDPSGESECMKQFAAGENVVRSPNRRWAIDEATGRTLHDTAGEPVRQITPYGPNNVIWRPDSAGAFLQSEYALLYLQIPDGDLLLVDDRSPTYISWVGME
jgi:hypothetical protein